MKAFLAATAVFALFGADVASAKAKEKAAPAPVATVAGEPLAAALPAYAQFQADITAVNGGSIQNAKDLERALDKAATLNRDDLTRGLIAYGALTAARNQTFVAEVRKVTAFYGRQRMVNGFLNNVKYAPGMPGGSDAVGSLARLAAADSERILTAGDSIKQKAREAQNLSWGKAASGVAAPRTTRLKALAAATAMPVIAPEIAGHLKVAVGSGDPSIDPTSFGGASFWRAISAPPTITATANPTSASPLTPSTDVTLVSLPSALPPTLNWTDSTGGASIRNKMVTLAALYVLDATEDQPAATETLLNDNITNGCLQGAQLQFYQCVASAKFNYENLACVGEAGLNTVGQCVKDVSR